MDVGFTPALTEVELFIKGPQNSRRDGQVLRPANGPAQPHG